MTTTALSPKASDASKAAPDAGAAHDDLANRGHPRGLYVLFASEAWERFSYYGMRAILTLYMLKGLGFAQATASNIYGTYTAFVYVTPLLGGYLADRVLGYRKSIILGGFIMAAGEFALAVPGLPTFFLGLGLLVIGNGFFKPNISTIVGTLYEEGDPRRDRGFTIFYMGINLGATLSPFVCGGLGESSRFGFGYGFAAAGVGMLIGNATFIFGQKVLGDRGRTPRENAKLREASPAATQQEQGEDTKPLTKADKERLAAIFIVGLFVIFFWMAFEQAGNTMTIWADKSTDRRLFGWEIPASWFQAVNAFFVITLAPLMSWVWKVLAVRRIEPSTPMKMVLGLSLLGLGFVPMVTAALVAGDGGKATFLFLIAAYFLHTVGELCLSPVGLSFVTKLAPKKLAALMMGVWFGFVALGNQLAGLLGSLYEKLAHTTFFAMFVGTSVGAALVMLVCLKPIKRLMHGVH